MDRNKERQLTENAESLGFVYQALRLDMEGSKDLSLKVTELMQLLESSGANPVTIYYITRGLNHYAENKLEVLGQAVEKGFPEESTINPENLKKVCDLLFAIALEDAEAIPLEERMRRLNKKQALQKKRPRSIEGYA
jgi:hypothetical protein